MAWKPDPESFAADAMQQDWNKRFGFALPPFSLIGRVINKVLWKNVEAMILVTPTWQTQPWYTLLLRMSIQLPLLLPALTNLQPNSLGEKNPLVKTRSLKLAALKITGKSWKLSSEAKLISVSRRPGSIADYKSAWNNWISWCDPVCAPLSGILNYLPTLFENGLQYRTINSHRSAISGYHNYIDGKPVGKHPRVCALLAGVFNQRPPQSRYTFV